MLRGGAVHPVAPPCRRVLAGDHGTVADPGRPRISPFAILGWPATTPSQGALASILVLAVVCTAAAFLVFAELIREVGPVRATVITYVNPAVAAVLGVLVLSETLTSAMLLGFALAIAGSALATRRPEPPEAEAAAVECDGSRFTLD